LILREEVRLLRDGLGCRSVAVATYDPASVLAEGVRTVDYFPHAWRARPFANIQAFFRTILEIARADVVVFGGGGILYDNEAGQSFAKLRSEWLLRIWIARFFRRRIFWCAVGVYVSSEHARSLRPLFA
jgi:polysaccharide pyruvyl transferase WcaK-like protein